MIGNLMTTGSWASSNVTRCERRLRDRATTQPEIRRTYSTEEWDGTCRECQKFLGLGFVASGLSPITP
ncbi:MAG TPA: hypothetical protein IGS31_09690 [Oscillatoriales cyanobacterium M4454_W2019_049]|nr:hypothetical protein [Oscillatoriales cyanobacterium M4454_W2019_049]